MTTWDDGWYERAANAPHPVTPRLFGQRVIAALAEAVEFATTDDGIDPGALLWALNDAGWYVGRQSDEFRAGYDAGRRTTQPTKPEAWT